MNERILSGRYVLNEVIGTGGMAVVYRAWDRQELREVAVKVLRSEYNEDAEFIRRFNHEAAAASQMSHPNIVGMYGVGQDGDARYIVMEYVKGRTLKELIRQAGRVKPQRAVQITLRILAAVDHAHRNHIVHRDIKPQNILIDAEGNVKVADFGIARATNSSTMTFTDSGNVLGSVHYFSPEQASGQVADEKSDLYSVGVVLYEMVTGEVPFDGETPVSVALKHVQEPPRSARLLEPEVSKGLDEVILKSLDKEASRRYQTAADMAGDLKRALRYPKGGFVNPPEEVKRQNREEFLKKFHQRARQLKKAAIFALVLCALGAAIFFGGRLYRDIFASVEVPNLKLLDLESAVADVKELQLDYLIEERHDAEIAMGLVISQYPEAGERVWPGERVRLVVSIGKEKLPMPDLRSLSRTDAVKVIEDNDLLLGEVTMEISDAQPGAVIDQSPAAGEWVKPGAVVTLSISGESAPMPDALGHSLEEAKSMLIANGFALGEVVEVDSDEPKGTVIEQSIAPNIKTLRGASVDLTISRYTYYAATEVGVVVPAGGAQVRCTIFEFGNEREIYNQALEEGEQIIPLQMASLEPGAHTVRVYINGEQVLEKEFNFE